MKKRTLLLLVLLPVIVLADFEDTFYPKTLRIDYYHSGDHRTEQYSFDEARIEPHWGGSMNNLIDTFHYGHHFFKVFEKASDSLIYSRGYSSLFREWQTTAEARKTRRSFTETVVCPLPRNACKIVFCSRDTTGQFTEKFHYDYDPGNYFISRGRGIEYPVFDAYVTGPSEQSIDIVVLPEGYSERELGRFVEDVIAFSKTLFQFSPYDKYADKFNIRGVLAPSLDS